jgi:hypothetical protein
MMQGATAWIHRYRWPTTLSSAKRHGLRNNLKQRQIVQ